MVLTRALRLSIALGRAYLSFFF